MKKAVVTGGAGFVGSHLAEELAERGYQVVILDDLSTGKKQNIEELLEKDNVEFIQGSITNLTLLKALFQSVDFVFHQAAIASVQQSIENPLASHQVNVTGTLNVLIAAKDSGVKKVCYASSSSVYGDTPTLPQRENMVPNPLSPYAANKLTGEYYCQVFHQVYGLSTACLRYFNVYGPRQDPNSEYAAVMPEFIREVLKGNPPVIFGDGEQSRDFIFIKDVVQANILMAESDNTGIFNVGRGESITINELAKLIINLTRRNIGPIHQQPRVGDVKHSIADSSKIKSMGYNPQWEMEAGLRDTIEWFSRER